MPRVFKKGSIIRATGAASLSEVKRGVLRHRKGRPRRSMGRGSAFPARAAAGAGVLLLERPQSFLDGLRLHLHGATDGGEEKGNEGPSACNASS